ncbi:MAG: hypothetical protein GY711_06790 [bacterium]|nr:hypothetical protein [bacterium]
MKQNSYPSIGRCLARRRLHLRTLAASGLSVDRLDGDLDQFHRDQVLARFRNQSVRVLIATDVAGRASGRSGGTTGAKRGSSAFRELQPQCSSKSEPSRIQALIAAS